MTNEQNYFITPNEIEAVAKSLRPKQKQPESFSPKFNHFQRVIELSHKVEREGTFYKVINTLVPKSH